MPGFALSHGSDITSAEISRQRYSVAMPLKANLELNAGTKTFASGLLPALIAALRRARPGDLIAISSKEANLGIDLEAWCRFTRNSLVDTSSEAGSTRWVVRYGEAPEGSDTPRPIGSRIWLYTNFDCNLRCDYCCVRPARNRRTPAVRGCWQRRSQPGGCSFRD